MVKSLRIGQPDATKPPQELEERSTTIMDELEDCFNTILMEKISMQENGKIYKYTNLINHKVYVGQTKQTLKQRDAKHQSQLSDNTYFHRALKKYGRNNFSLELVEDHIPFQELDEKEKYYINYFNSFYTTGRGYNLTQGGQWSSGTQKLTISQADTIKYQLKETFLTFSEIASPFDVSIYCISDINNGRSFYDDTINYPIRPFPRRSELNEEVVDIIVDMLLNTNMTQQQIADNTSVNTYTVGEINRGSSKWCPTELDYPIRKPIQSNTYQNKITPTEVQQICFDLCFSDMTIIQIGDKYGIAKNTVSDISRGITWKNITQQFQCPIRKNKLVNQNIYRSVYGIV